jgi:hypothetical protein
VKKEREVPWLVYSRQPDCVFFSHVAHVKMGKMDCVTCHGPIGESESLKPFQQNRITGYSDIWGENIRPQTQPWDRMNGRLRGVPREGSRGRRRVQTQRTAAPFVTVTGVMPTGRIKPAC